MRMPAGKRVGTGGVLLWRESFLIMGSVRRHGNSIPINPMVLGEAHHERQLKDAHPRLDLVGGLFMQPLKRFIWLGGDKSYPRAACYRQH